MSTTGCLVIPHGPSSEIPANAEMNLGAVAFHTSITGEYSETWNVSESTAVEGVQTALVDSGYFSSVRESGTARGDMFLSVEVEVQPSGYEYVQKIVSAYSLFTIPTWGTYDLALSVAVYTPSGGHHSYTSRGSSTIIIWFPLVILTPFFGTGSAAESIIEDGISDVLAQMAAEEVLPVRETGVAWSPGAIGQDTPREAGHSYGTGFFISQEGHLVTSNHVVEGSTTVTVSAQGWEHAARVIAADARSDLAILELVLDGTDPPSLSTLPVRTGEGARVGEPVFTMGFPQVEVQGSSAKFTEGVVSSLTGMANDSSLLQVSVPVQPGNSGGPLLDSNGNVIGVIASKLSDAFAIKRYGSVPQNVNYAVKIHSLVALLEGTSDVPALLAASVTTRDRADTIGRVQRAICKVEAFREEPSRRGQNDN